MTHYQRSSDDHDFDVDHGRGQAPRMQSKSWKQTQSQQARKKSGPTSYNGMHRRRKRRIDW